MIQYDGVQRYVEAPNMVAAVAVWRKGMLEENVDAAHNGGWEGNEDPEQVVLIDEEPVIR